MNFRSDNEAPAAPEIMAALADANAGSAHAYGDDAISARLDRAFSDLFETDVRVLPVVTGTAANSLSLAALTPPYGVVYCHARAHIANDEGGAPEFYTGGAKLVPLQGEHAKIDAAALDAAIAATDTGPHGMTPATVSITQATELGTVYTVDEVAAMGEAARRHGLGLHMDGARFANAVATLGCAPADITWRAGVDLLSFGATKNGALAAEAVLLFRPDLAQGLVQRRMRGGHLWSKSRFLAAQLMAYVEDGLWLRHAARANALATRLADALAATPGVALLHPVAANIVWLRMPAAVDAALRDAGFEYHGRGGAGVARLVVPYDADAAHIDAFIATAQDAAQDA